MRINNKTRAYILYKIRPWAETDCVSDWSAYLHKIVENFPDTTGELVSILEYIRDNLTFKQATCRAQFYVFITRLLEQVRELYPDLPYCL